ncbi:MAG TPA: type I restriction-modification enzyme R subunit C-terminal domain-containing protein, partial [Ktedonobacterales bacterium]|nr:type I restriction-modification enzyme R subunit C-terminal domain-containing protein [Ktedonobacterales bacterium]
PRQLAIPVGAAATREAQADAAITADNYRHFGEPVYEYDMGQGIEDGYLAACEIVRRDIFLERHDADERVDGVSQRDLWDKQFINARTGQPLTIEDARAQYVASTFEDKLLLPERVEAMCRDLFDQLRDSGGPEQKTIIFCARDEHADRVAAAMNNLYAAWCAANGRRRAEPYAFKCTAAGHGSDSLPDLRGAARHHFIATTVDLLTTGVDVPSVRNIVFFKYVKSPISFYQMVGRGTRLDPASGKLMFRVYDYTNATRLFGEDFLTRLRAPKREAAAEEDSERPEREREPIIVAEGFTVRVDPAGRLIVASVDGVARPILVEDYKRELAQRLLAEAPTLAEFRQLWVAPTERQRLLAALPDGGRMVEALRQLDGLRDCDLYDVLADLAYELAPRTRVERADEFTTRDGAWLASLPGETAAVIRALAAQFALDGTEALESPRLFDTPEVARAGGLPALAHGGAPAELLRETKERIFAA